MINEITFVAFGSVVGGIIGNLAEWRRSRREISEAWATADEQRKRAWEAEGRLRVVSKIVRRTLACGQLEKLDDAKPHLSVQP